MINSSKKIIVIIPARGGSKGIPGKNIKIFNGKPLINYSIEYALESDLISEVFVSTDNHKIAEISENMGAKIIWRPNHISGDTATTESAVEHALTQIQMNPKQIILLQATSPLRPKNSLSKIIEHFNYNNFDSLLTISPTHRFFWELKNDIATANYDYLNRPRRQDMKDSEIKYIENGSVYIFTKNNFKETKNRLGGKIGYYIFPEEYSFELDSINDWFSLEQIAQHIKN
jgi:CMP-N,N'-diacetyllegionaminic acid synthase